MYEQGLDTYLLSLFNFSKNVSNFSAFRSYVSLKFAKIIRKFAQNIFKKLFWDYCLRIYPWKFFLVYA